MTAPRIVWDDRNTTLAEPWAEYFQRAKERPEPVVRAEEVKETSKEKETER